MLGWQFFDGGSLIHQLATALPVLALILIPFIYPASRLTRETLVVDTSYKMVDIRIFIGLSGRAIYSSLEIVLLIHRFLCFRFFSLLSVKAREASVTNGAHRSESSKQWGVYGVLKHVNNSVRQGGWKLLHTTLARR
jgi:hypothetical protein